MNNIGVVIGIVAGVSWFIGFWVGVFTESSHLKKWYQNEIDKCYERKESGGADNA